MRENVYKTFKFTPKTTRASLVWALAVPLVLYYGIADQNVSFQGSLKHQDRLWLTPLHIRTIQSTE